MSTTAKQVAAPSTRRDEVQRVEVLVIGGRCAVAPLATHLARAGVSVLVADRARFPSDTLSTHVFQGGAIASLDRLGVLEEVLATGAPAVARGWAHGFGATGAPPHVLIQAQRDILARPDGAERFWGPSMQRISPPAILGPTAMLRAAVHGASRGRLSPRQAVSDLAGLDARYRRALRTRAVNGPGVAPTGSPEEARA